MTINVRESFTNLFENYGRHLLGVFVVVLCVHDVFGNHGFLVMSHKQQEIQKVRIELDRLNKENSALEEDRKNLKSDPADDRTNCPRSCGVTGLAKSLSGCRHQRPRLRLRP